MSYFLEKVVFLRNNVLVQFLLTYRSSDGETREMAVRHGAPRFYITDKIFTATRTASIRICLTLGLKTRLNEYQTVVPPRRGSFSNCW